MLIAQISDLHLRPRGVAAYRVSETNMMAEKAIDALLALSPRPDAVIVTGDVADGKLEAEYRLALELFARACRCRSTRCAATMMIRP
jgi:3',5'-cyclic AMP phosphodiesterase CpdA